MSAADLMVRGGRIRQQDLAREREWRRQQEAREQRRSRGQGQDSRHKPTKGG